MQRISLIPSTQKNGTAYEPAFRVCLGNDWSSEGFL